MVIGYNEGRHLRSCLRSVQQCAMHESDYEILYVDGGSTDGSAEIALEFGELRILGGDRRRRAAENRNLGLVAAKGEYIQFLDGDMELHPAWPAAAIKLLEEKADVACVFGQLEEKQNNVFYDALQLDWEQPEGLALYCGGAALWRRAPLRELGGFPEEVQYGEEPYLCWRLRNQLKLRVWHLHRVMAQHDLAYKGFGDYWRRNIRVGESYAEVAHLCAKSSEPFWSSEVTGNLRWGVALAAGAFVVALGPSFLKALALLALIVVLARKTWQTMQRDTGFEVALIYAVHTYLAKVGIAYGIWKWQRNNRTAA